jgi:lauroyl/myristoyl acyltransferase
MFQDTIKRLKRSFARNGLYFSTWLLNKLPYSAVRSLTDVMVAVGFRLTLRQRKIARESLQIAFGNQKDRTQLNQIIRDCFRNLGRGMIELIYFLEHPQMIRERVFFEGKEFLDEAFQQNPCR